MPKKVKKILAYSLVMGAVINWLSLTMAQTDNILDLWDTTTTTDSGNTGGVLDLGTGTNDVNNTNNDNTLDLGVWDNQNQDNTIDVWNWNNDVWNWSDVDNNVIVEYEKVKDGEYKFNYPIPDANKSYVVEFTGADKNMILSTIIINDNNISDNLKKSFTIVIKTSNNKKTYTLDDLDVKSINISKGDKIYLIYNPWDNIDNTAELSLLNNELKIYAKEIPQPYRWWELQLNNGEIEMINPVVYKQASEQSEIVTYNPKIKKAIAKKDTGPVENTILLSLLFIILLAIVGLYFRKQQD